MSNDQDSPLDDGLQVGAHRLHSRLIVGTGKYATYPLMAAALEQSGTQCITVAVRRERLIRRRTGRTSSILIDPQRYTLLPNTAGCFTADDAVRVARLGREILSQTGKPRCRLGQARGARRHARRCCPIRWPRSQATEKLVAEGFQVLCYTSDDPSWPGG